MVTVDYRKIKESAYNYIGAYLEQFVSHVAETINSDFSAAEQVARSTADFITIHPELSSEQIHQIIKDNLIQNPLIYGSAIAFEPNSYDSNKELYSPYAWKHIVAEEKDGTSRQYRIRTMDIGRDAYDYREWEWYKRIKQTEKGSWVEPYFDEGAGNMMMTTYSAPFFKEGKFWGVATVDVSLESLQQLAARGELGLEDLSFALISQEGRFISHPQPKMIMQHTIFSVADMQGRPEIKKLGHEMLKNKTGVALIEKFPWDETSFMVYAPVPSTGWILSVAVPESKVMVRVWAELSKFSSFMFISLGVLILVIFIASLRITNPIRKLSREFQQVSMGNLEIKRDTKYPKDEIGQLAETFHRMVTALRTYISALTKETSMRESVESELRIAREIQAQLLPQTFPPYPDRKEFDLHAVNVPARHVAGDFYDFFFLSEDELAIIIADVSGKGVPAAMFMAVARTLIRNLACVAMTPSEVLEKVNKTLVEDNQNGLFVTLIFAYYNVKTGLFRYVNAGHLLPYLRQADGKNKVVGEVTGTVAGILEDQTFETKELQLQTGESLLFYTDGVPEARNDEQEFYGFKRFEELLASIKTENICELCDLVFKEVEGFQQSKLSDDLTLVALRRNLVGG